MNGCNLRPGDLTGTGTINGPKPESYGSLLELTWKPNRINQSLNGDTRSFLEDGDEVIITGLSKGGDYNVGFGTCSWKIVPPLPLPLELSNSLYLILLSLQGDGCIAVLSS